MHWIDPQSLPATRGTVMQFVMNRDRAFDGLLLATGEGNTRLVHFPPHMSGKVANAIKIGDAIAVHGVRPRGAEVIAAVSLVTESGAVIIDEGPDAPYDEVASFDEDAFSLDAHATGTVRISLYGPKGELRGAVLEDGTAVRVGKKEAGAFADLLKPGAVVAVCGTAIVCQHGTVIDVGAVGADAGHLRPVKEEKERKPEKPKKHAEDDARAEA